MTGFGQAFFRFKNTSRHKNHEEDPEGSNWNAQTLLSSGQCETVFREISRRVVY